MKVVVNNIRKDNGFILHNFAEHIKNIEISLYNRNPEDSNKPVAIEKKTANSDIDTVDRTLSWNNLIHILNGAINMNSIIQKFNHTRARKA